VIDHEVHEQFDAALVHFGKHVFPIRQRAKLLLDVAVVANVISVVIVR
jgi:hypothetical protein